jgi:hypothetical protein
MSTEEEVAAPACCPPVSCSEEEVCCEWGSAPGCAAPTGSSECGRGGSFHGKIPVARDEWHRQGVASSCPEEDGVAEWFLVRLMWVRLPVKAVLPLCSERLMAAPAGVVSLLRASM